MQTRNHTHILTIEHLNVRYQQTAALDNISLKLPSNGRTAIIGPNGAGKSTFIKAILGLVKADSQNIRLFNQPLAKVRDRIAYVPQTSEVNWQFPTTVYDVVLMGVTSKRWGFQKISHEQKQSVEDALNKMQLLDLKDRQINQLSGGQKQRVFIARAIAQNADLYFLDEPLAGVDIKSEQLIMDQLIAFQAAGKTSVTVHHDLNTVPEYFDSVILLNRQLIASGSIQDSFTPENIHLTYHGLTTSREFYAQSSIDRKGSDHDDC